VKLLLPAVAAILLAGCAGPAVVDRMAAESWRCRLPAQAPLFGASAFFMALGTGTVALGSDIFTDQFAAAGGESATHSDCLRRQDAPRERPFELQRLG
jgi:hypothetical protein